MGINDLFDALLQIMARDKMIFVQLSLYIWREISIALWMLYGLYTMFNEFDPWRGLKLFFKCGMVFSILTFWDSPAPFLGVSSTAIVTNQSRYMAKMVSNNSESAAFDALTQMEAANSKAAPAETGMMGLPSARALIIWAVIEALICVMQFLVWLVIGYGFIATAVCEIIGPFCIAVGMWPGLEKITWGWLMSFIQYAFYGVIGAIYVDIVAQLLVFFLVRRPPPWSSVDEWMMVPALSMLIAPMIAGLFVVGSLTANIVTGRAGDTPLPRLIRSIV